jgi:hypothetical protein
MTKKVFALDTKPGVQRDGTVFDKQFYNSGRWVRFQRGRPRKIGGFRQIVDDLAGPSRGIYLNPQQNFNNVFNGYSGGLQVLPINNSGVGSGITDFTLSGFTANANNLWQFDTFYDISGSGDNLLLAHPGQNLSLIDNNVNTPVLGGSVTGTSLSPIGVFTQVAATITSGSPNITLSSVNVLIGAGQSVSGTGIPSGATVVSITTTALVISAPATANGSSITLTFDNNISVSGGVVTLHPYVFVYGNSGLIKNCSAGNAQDWVSADANEVSVATGKIVQGLPVRGGSNAPSGLFWSLDSLIRVSYIGGVGTPPQFWRYDLISSQSSILSSQSVIEYDGVYYWCGVDRFLLYNGVVKEIPNTFNQNYFFDNLNYAQREKVWVSKVPRFGEIWWFYPRGSATECTDAIIYNVRENCWYDAGESIGAQRSAGYFSQVFHYPLTADWNVNASGGILTATITNAGSGYTNGTYTNRALTGGAGTGATANITVAGGVVTSVTINGHGTNYAVGNTLSASIPGGAGFVLTVATLMNFVSLYQNEIGTDKVVGATALAIESYFETNDLGWVSGGPSQPSSVGDNKWLRLERVEPDFVQSGTMQLYVTGRPFAQSADQTSSAYPFDPDTNKIDMREQRRELRLKFVSNVAGGDYQLGRVILDADLGDVRPY